MGIYINKGNEGFRQIRKPEYVDKYPAVYMDMTKFTTRYNDERIVKHIQEELMPRKNKKSNASHDRC